MNRLGPPNPNQGLSETDSITGRRKVVLAPGHSLLDWIRLGRSEGDLSGVGSNKAPISFAELEKHNTAKDIWMAVRGKVYNISPYMEFHPGGTDELMRSAGKDGTELFDEIHNWVNVDSMLEKCYVGPLQLDKKDKTPKPVKSSSQSSEGSKQNLLGVSTSPSQLRPPKDVPKFPLPTSDWYQNGEWVTVVVYTQCTDLTSESVLVENDNETLLVQVVLHQNSFFVHVSPHNPILEINKDDGDDGATVSDASHNNVTHNNVSEHESASPVVNDETDAAAYPAVIKKDHLKLSVQKGKVEVKLKKKNTGQQWHLLGIPLKLHSTYPRTRHLEVRYQFWTCFLNKEVTHDTRLLGFRSPSSLHMITPIGYHIRIKRVISGMTIARSYTVVSPSLTKSSEDADVTSGKKIYLMIKSYKGGVMSPWICGTTVGTKIPISNYDGTFDLNRLRTTTCLVMFAAGSGLTSMICIIRYALESKFTYPVKLVFFNKSQQDILWKDQLEALARSNKRFSVINILSRESDPNWKGLRGRVDKKHIEDAVPNVSDVSRPLLLVSGPYAYNDSVESLAKSHGLGDKEMHIFAQN